MGIDSMPKASSPEDPELPYKLRDAWLDGGNLKDFEAELEGATSMSEIFQAMRGLATFNYVCGKDAVGEFQYAHMDRLKPILDGWLYIEGNGDDKAQEQYERAVTLLEEFPGDALRRKLDQMLRHLLGINKVEGWM